VLTHERRRSGTCEAERKRRRERQQKLQTVAKELNKWQYGDTVKLSYPQQQLKSKEEVCKNI
jgi:hypothetical protein